jgi:hypothetical protein
MKANYRHQKKLKEQARLARQAEKLQRRTGGKIVEDQTPTVKIASPAKPPT